MKNYFKQLCYLKSNNIKKICTEINGEPYIIPRRENDMELYKKSLTDFFSFYDCVSNISVKSYKSISNFFKLKYNIKSFEELVWEYEELRNRLEWEKKRKLHALSGLAHSKKEPFFYNEEEERAINDGNIMVGDANASFLFIAPYNLAMFYRENNNSKRFLSYMKEARKTAMIQENSEGIDLCEKALKEFKRHRKTKR